MAIICKCGQLATILLMVFIDFVGIGLVFPLFSSMLFAANSNFLVPETSQVVRGLWLGILVALMPFAQFFSGPILGVLSDRLGRKPLMLTSIFLGMLGYSIAVMGVWCSSIILLVVSRIVVGMAAGNDSVGCAAISDVSTPEEKTKHFGLMHMAAGFGFTIGPFFGGKLSFLHLGFVSGYEIPFVFAGLLCMINLVTVIFLFKETHHAKRAGGIISFGLSNLKKAWRMPGFGLLFLAIFFYNFGWEFYWQFFPVYLIATYKFDVAMLSNLCAWAAIIYALSSGWLIRPWVAKFKTESILFYALVGGALSLAIPLLSSAAWMCWFYLPIQEYLIALVFPATTALISNKSSSEVQGEMMGILQSVQSIALVIGPLAAGFLMGFTVKMPMIVGAGSFLLAAYILRQAKRGRLLAL